MITPMALATYSLIVLFIFGLAALVLIISRPTQEERERNGEQQVSFNTNKGGFICIAALFLFFTILTMLTRKAQHT
jgi:hypothetical protein